jgi:acyl carrier protein
MVPAAFVTLERLPLNANGKVDRRMLPAPGRTRVGAAVTYAAPSTPDETALAEIFAALLRVDRVGVHDNFFDLGGHSLLATQVVSRARGALGVELPLRAVFSEPTIAGLAAHVATLRAQPGTAPRADELNWISTAGSATARTRRESEV